MQESRRLESQFLQKGYSAGAVEREHKSLFDENKNVQKLGSLTCNFRFSPLAGSIKRLVSSIGI